MSRSTCRRDGLRPVRLRGHANHRAGLGLDVRPSPSSSARPGAAQAVGRALGRNPVPLIVPCHRVVAAKDARVGSLLPAADDEAEALALEGAPIELPLF
ncbi:MAG: MGMT family protein [Ilumatobacteraceae bacterium]